MGTVNVLCCFCYLSSRVNWRLAVGGGFSEFVLVLLVPERQTVENYNIFI